MKDKLKNFLDEESNLSKIIVIYGPTACGKTDLSLEITSLVNGEIISADSRQIYRGLDIGTGKIKPDEMKGIPHYMIDILNIDNEYSVGVYKKETEIIIKKIHEKGKIPVICGGTGLYIDSIIYNFDIPKVGPDWNYREKLEKIRLEKGNDFLWEMLYKVDQDYAKILSPNNFRYVIRGLEIFEKTGKSKLDIKCKNELKYNVLFLTPYDGDREKLYNKINLRIDEMFKNGFIKEVDELMKKYPKNSFGLNTIGYKEILQYLDGNLSLDECINLVKQHNRNYAKRQLTWFRKYNYQKNFEK